MNSRDTDTKRKTTLLASIKLLKDAMLTDIERNYMDEVYRYKKFQDSNNFHAEMYDIFLADTDVVIEDKYLADKFKKNNT